MEVAIHAARGFLGVTIIPAGEERLRLGAFAGRGAYHGSRNLEILERWGVQTTAGVSGSASAAAFRTSGARGRAPERVSAWSQAAFASAGASVFPFCRGDGTG